MVLLLSTVLSGNIWQELELEPKLWTKVEPESESKINNFGSATLVFMNMTIVIGKTVLTSFSIKFKSRCGKRKRRRKLIFLFSPLTI